MHVKYIKSNFRNKLQNSYFPITLKKRLTFFIMQKLSNMLFSQPRKILTSFCSNWIKIEWLKQ